MAIENNLASYTEIFAEKGKDFSEEAKQIAEDKLLLEKLMQTESEVQDTDAPIPQMRKNKKTLKRKWKHMVLVFVEVH